MWKFTKGSCLFRGSFGIRTDVDIMNTTSKRVIILIDTNKRGQRSGERLRKNANREASISPLNWERIEKTRKKVVGDYG